MGTSEPDGFLLSWLPEIEDYYEAFRADARARGTRWKSLVIFVPALAVFMVAGLGHQWVVAILGLAVAMYGALMSPPYPRQIRVSWRRSQGMRASAVCRIVAGVGLIPLSVPDAETMPWSSFDGVLETDRVFVLHLARSGGLSRLHPRSRILVLAKRGLDSPRDVPRLRELLIRETVPAAQGSLRPEARPQRSSRED